MTEKNERVPTVFVVDDDEAVRSSLERLISGAGHRVETFASAEAFLSAYDPSRPGCIILDVRMPGKSGLEMQEQLRQEHVHAPIIVITGHGTIPMAVRATRAGAMEVMEKPPDPRVLLDKVREALDRDARHRSDALDREFVHSVVRSMSANERELLARLVAGQSIESIASDLGLSIGQVHQHRESFATRLGSRGYAILTRLAGQGMTIHTLG